MDAPLSRSVPSRPPPPRGFTMTELLVVIGVIAVLAGILLAAMGGVRKRALSTQTESTMQEFSKGCEAFVVEHNRYPGMVPEHILAQAEFLSGMPPELSGTENGLLDLMGGARILTPLDDPDDPEFANFGTEPGAVVISPDLVVQGWQLKIDLNRLGEGPLVDGRLYSPYFTPSEAALRAIKGQESETDPTLPIPDLVDAWGQPIIYLRRARTNGPLVGALTTNPQFFAASMTPYTQSIKLGNLGENQMGLSILNVAQETDDTLAQILRHPAFGTYGNVGDALNGTARGAYALMSAGADGVYFSIQDGPGTPKVPVDDIVTDSENSNPKVVEEYDDIRVFGGG